MSELNREMDEGSVLQNDLRELMGLLGMSDHARPQLPHEVFQEALAELKRRLDLFKQVGEARDAAGYLGSIPACISDLSKRADLAEAQVARRFGPAGYLVMPIGLDEEHWRMEMEEETDPEYVCLPMFTEVDPFAAAAERDKGDAVEAKQPSSARVVSDEEIERMVAAMVAQSTAYPVVPPGYNGRVDPLHPFTARQCLLAALRVGAEPAPPISITPADLQLLMQLIRDNRHNGARPVIESNQAAWDQAFRLSDLGLIAIQQIAQGGCLHITRHGAAVARRLVTAPPVLSGEKIV